MYTFVISIPPTDQAKLRHSAFQWTITISEQPLQECQYQISSTKNVIGKIKVNGFTYENIIFDFEKGKVRISMKEKNLEAVRNLLNSLTFQTSPTSRAYFIMSPRKRPETEL